MARNPFNATGGLKPRRSVFDLSYRKNFTCDMGQLIPVMADETVPGDHFTIGSEVVVRFQPLVAPIMHEITATVHYFFVPYRILWDNWEEFISQGQLGGSNLPISIPRFPITDSANRSLGTLWDYFGMPIGDDAEITYSPLAPIDMPWRAYNRIYNEYYRDQDLQEEIDELNPFVLNRNWRKDYFTASRPFRQKGTAPALPVNVDISGINNPISGLSTVIPLYAETTRQDNSRNLQAVDFFGTAGVPSDVTSSTNPGWGRAYDWIRLNPNEVKLSTSLVGVPSQLVGDNLRAQSTTFDVSDLRLAFQTQKWLERNARAGTRYTEFLRSHFGVAPSDSRLDRPEYIGGVKLPVHVSEVVQTSETTGNSPQAQMAGHGLAADGSLAGKYFTPEFGIIMGILSVMPKPAYQNGMDRQWLRQLPTDFYFPEFCRLSEQAIKQAEVYYGFGRYDDEAIFGFTGQYDEMRVKHDMVCSEMRKTSLTPEGVNLSYWNMARYFPAPPSLNSNFITCVPHKDIFAVQDVPGLIVNAYNRIRAIRPMPEIADPGLVDHY